MPQFIMVIPFGMETVAISVTVAVHRLAGHSFTVMSYIVKINEPSEARICHDQSYADEGILIRDLELYVQ